MDTAVGKQAMNTLPRARFLSARTFFHALPTVIVLVPFFQRLGSAVQRIINKSNVVYRCLYSNLQRYIVVDKGTDHA